MLTVEQIKHTVADYFKDKPVKSVYLFGSYAKGEAKEDSDVDLLVEFEESKKRLSLYDILGFQIALEDIFKRKVDLVEDRLVHSWVRKNIDKNKVPIIIC